jgi:hypothetical protein
MSQAYQAIPQEKNKDNGMVVAPTRKWDPQQAVWLARVESKGIAVKVWGEVEEPKTS